MYTLILVRFLTPYHTLNTKTIVSINENARKKNINKFSMIIYLLVYYFGITVLYFPKIFLYSIEFHIFEIGPIHISVSGKRENNHTYG